MKASDPDAVLARIASLHPAAIDPGLTRLRRVAGRAGLARPGVPLAIVAGTNGKGSTVTMLGAVWQAAGHRVGTSTSPHLVRFNERIRIDGVPVSDACLLKAIATLEPHIAPDTLTYFEIATLAAMACFRAQAVDAIVLEVGLGGRLDAANLWDADVAILTSVALDHAEWLGTDLEHIAMEKAAVARRGGALIVGASPVPASLGPFARANGIELVIVDSDGVPELPRLPGEHQRRNAACAIEAVGRMASRLPVTAEQLRRGLRGARIEARMQRLQRDGVEVCLDVAHNPHAASALATALGQGAGQGAGQAASQGAGEGTGDKGWHLIFAALADKDIEGIVRALAPIARSFACPDIDGARALPASQLAARVRAALDDASVPVSACASVRDADALALSRARARGGGVLVAGSFLTVGGWLDLRAAAGP